jgi:oxygen-independent coproporphyrinogen III oxidase
LIGLGASAIGSLRQGFVQNAPDTAGYSRALMSGQFSTVRGFALSADDRIRGRIIESLMCNLECDIDEVVDQVAAEGGHGRDSFEQEIEALQPFLAGGFAYVDGRRIVVHESGRPYLRLIAATFDAYLPDSHARHSIAV